MKPSNITRIKICCIKSLREARIAIEAGASAIGLVSPMPSGPGTILEQEIAAIVEKVPPSISTFLLTCKIKAEEIIEQHKICKTSTIQLCDYVEDREYSILKKSLPGIKIVQVVHVVSESDVQFAILCSKFVDAVLLDSGNPCLKIKELGGTGRTHNWKISKEIRERLEIPVFLAGGLCAENVAEAISEVGPYSLDVCSGVRTKDCLDEIKLRKFLETVNLVNQVTYK